MFRGAYTALVTPFRDGRVDDDALSRLVEEQIEAGIDGLVPCGTTGESPALSHAEHVHVVEVVLRAARGKVPVLAGAGSNSTREAIEVGRACKELGASGQLQITPYYNKPSQDGLIAHFQAIAEAVALPMVLYNVPGRTGVDMLPESVARLASEQPLVRGIKEATGDMHRAARIRELCGDDFALLSGDDFSLLPFLAVGGDGVISVVSNCMPDVMAKLCKAAREDRWAEAKELHYKHLPLSRALFSRSNPMPVKTAMAILGKIAPEIRLPLQILPEGSPERGALTRELKSLGLLT
jgi:4-hydroxy-tetrahydrodipicolinate synthase